MAVPAESQPVMPGGSVPKLSVIGVGVVVRAPAVVVRVAEVLDPNVPPLMEAFTFAAFAVRVKGGSTVRPAVKFIPP